MDSNLNEKNTMHPDLVSDEELMTIQAESIYNKYQHYHKDAEQINQLEAKDSN